MKKQLLFIFMLLTFINKAQQPAVFCPSGAEWRYLVLQAFGLPTPYTYPKVKYLRDSVMDGETVKVLRYEIFYTQENVICDYYMYLKQHEDTIFMKCCKTNDTWQILYNFAATQGQQWLTTVSDNTTDNAIPITHTITVNATTTVNINGWNLKRLLVTYCHTDGITSCISGAITERIGYQGSTGYYIAGGFLFNYYKRIMYSDYDMLVDFLCYRDNDFSPTSFSTTRDCNYYLGIEENEQISQLKIYPNPVGEMLNVEYAMLNENLFVSFIDIYGREVKRVELEKEIEVKDLASGIYILNVSNSNKEILYRQKLVKE